MPFLAALSRLVLIGIGLIFLWRWLRRVWPQPPVTPPSKPVIQLVRCHYCNLHLNRDEALSVQDRYYCSQAHYLQDQQDQTDPPHL